MKIDYFGHSGFLVETASCLLLFESFRADPGTIDGKPKDKPLFVFVSHAHADHFDPAIFSIAGRTVRYLLSFDLRGNKRIPEDRDVRFLDAHETYGIEGLGTVRTLRSTDEGVAFLVQTPDETLFHAGDLHWWDWPGEDPDWLAAQKTLFQAEIRKLAGIWIDAACVVLDDRLEEHFAEGMTFFLSVCQPRYVLPMHFWKDKTVTDRFLALPGACNPDTVLINTAKETHWEI